MQIKHAIVSSDLITHHDVLMQISITGLDE